MNDTCPTCGQPWRKRKRRVCADCKIPILKGHRYYFDGPTARHRDCQNPKGRPEQPPATMELL